MLEALKKKNPSLPLYSVTSEAFAPYGRVIEGLDTTALLAAANAISRPSDGSAYTPSEPSFEALPLAREIEKRFFGELPAQLGYCHGHNRRLNAAEWHTSSELNVAITPLILLLALRSEMKDGALDASAFRAFLVPAGTVLEVYATSLHFCPCEVGEEGFGCVVGLPVGTNTPLSEAAADPLLFRKNKWLIAHNDNAALLSRGVKAGISGENTEIKY